MKLYKKLLILMALVHISMVFSQSEIPVGKYEGSRNPYGKLYEKLDLNAKLFGGVTMFNFQNRSYSLSLANKEISNTIGYTVGLEYTIKSFTITGQYVINKFTLENRKNQFPKLSGSDFSLAWNLPPGVKWTNFFIGGGYSFYKLELYKSEEEAKPMEVMKIFTPSVKIGFYIRLSDMANLKAEYQQSFDMESKFAYNRISLTLGLGPYY